ncbi:MAG: hypothetical protein ACI360_06355 [Atopobiaceae bacterium]
MAQKASDAQKAPTLSKARKQELQRIEDQYGKILARVEFQLSPSLQLEMAKLIGPENSTAYFNLVAGGLSLLIVVLMMASRDFTPVAVVLIFVTVGVLAAARRYLTMKAHWLDKHGYPAAQMGPDDLINTYATASHIVVQMPDGQIQALPLSQLKHMRHDENNCVATFQGGHAALFARKPMGATAFNVVVDLLHRHEPPSWAERVAAKLNRH